MAELEQMKRGELLEEAKRLGIEGAFDKDKKSTIKTAIEAHNAEQVHLAAEGQKPEHWLRPTSTNSMEPPPSAPPAPTGKPLTAEQIGKLRKANTDQIRAVLEDPKLLPQWRTEFQIELDGRCRMEEQEDERKKMTSPIQKYLITKGGRFVVRGYATELRTGGVVTGTTHNLDQLKAQGIEFEPLKGKVVVARNEMGRTITKIVDAPAEPEKLTGEAPVP